MHWDIGGFKPYDIDIVCAFDIDSRKVGKEIHRAIFEAPNCTKIFCDTFNIDNSVVVSKGKQMDGVSNHMINKKNDKYFIPVDDSDINEEKILSNIKEKRKGKTTILVPSRVSTVEHLDRIIVLNEGKVEAFDTHENLLKISPTYKRMVDLQKLEESLGEKNG